MSDIDNNGCYAFPLSFIHQYGVHEGKLEVIDGMSLRDYFICHAPPMPDWYRDIFMARESLKKNEDSEYEMKRGVECVIEWQMEYADAVIRARKGETK